jgi:hypothetical protein
MSASTTPADSSAIAAASRFERSEGSLVSSFSDGATFSNKGFSAVDGFSTGCSLAVVEDFSVLDAFALAEVFSGAFALDVDFSALGALAEGFSFVDVLGLGAVVPFAEEVVVLLDGVDFDDGDAFSVVVLAAGADAVAESPTDLGAVSGFTAGAHALAMTIAISGIRA